MRWHDARLQCTCTLYCHRDTYMYSKYCTCTLTLSIIECHYNLNIINDNVAATSSDEEWFMAPVSTKFDFLSESLPLISFPWAESQTTCTCKMQLYKIGFLISKINDSSCNHSKLRQYIHVVGQNNCFLYCILKGIKSGSKKPALSVWTNMVRIHCTM